MMQSVAKKFKTSDEQADVVANRPSHNEVRRQLARHRAQRCTPVPDPLNLRDETQLYYCQLIRVYNRSSFITFIAS